MNQVNLAVLTFLGIDGELQLLRQDMKSSASNPDLKARKYFKITENPVGRNLNEWCMITA